jgi:hypothetical protein
MILTAHQPNYLPWAGYFHKMAQCDFFVFMDTVQYARRSYTARCRYKGADGAAHWLSVPVFKTGRYGQSIGEVAVDNQEDWQAAHRRTWGSFYAKAPYFAAQQGLLDLLYGRTWMRLADLNAAAIEALAATMGIAPRLVKLSELNVTGRATDLLVGACRALGADVYLSGPSGRNYLDAAAFADAGIELRYTNFQPETHSQLWGSFAPGLSVLDLLFNCGPEAAHHFIHRP